ncbi:MAG: hypothetical protein IK125_05515 [Lachnospiraceae bacterium]|nr:hypothetical protein [Lachnospiraceae bacterium]
MTCRYECKEMNRVQG